MARYSILQNFYASDAWRNFRSITILERAERCKKNNEIFKCEYCGKPIVDTTDVTLHHVTELTPKNVHDINISLNPDNVIVVHHDCHNKIHNRFGYESEKKVYLVYGPPLSGKKTYVKENAERGDLIIDMDELYKAISFLPYYDKPNNLLQNVRGVYNQLLDNVKTRHGKWNNAYIIGGYADKYKREKILNDLGAELVFCNVSKEECLSRLECVDDMRKYMKSEWKEYIERWFESYVP